MANKIDSIEIFPGENGGHRVVHNFNREASKKEGAMAGALYMERPKSAVVMPALTPRKNQPR